MPNTPDCREALLSCPFCGDAVPALYQGHGTWRVRCTHCGAEPFTHSGRSSAVRDWNTRAALAHPLAQPADEREAREDARQLRLHASGLTYNDTTAEAEAKHRLHEIAMRIETGYYCATRAAMAPKEQK